MMLRRSLVTLAFAAVATTGVASAKRMPVPPPPRPVLVISTTPALVEHIQTRDAVLVACARGERAAVIATRVTLRWDSAARVRAVSVRGGTVRFNRCAARALRGTIAGVTGRGIARATMKVQRPVAPSRPAPTALDACQVDADCTIYFRLQACVPQEPLAINRAQGPAARAAFPPRRLECAMGGPDYDELVRANERRWSTSCAQARCVLHDAGVPARPRGLP
ncbi:MAG: hypothetical protein IPL61_35515 [Myxococcales bacterium]|nr:hypothetical protein [Myxococcales bacterium]